jgi:zinc/manganese transport system substrate-binding protein
MRRLIALLALATAVASCAGAADDPGLTIVATTTIIGDIVSEVVGDAATVTVVIPAGADPHEFQPSAAQIAAMDRADLVVVNGLGLEAGMVDALDALAEDGARVLELGPLLDPIPFEEAHEDEDHEDEGHGSESLDPHFWLDPLRVADAADQIADEMSSIDPEGDWATRADDYAVRLMAAHEEIEQTLSQVTDRRLVTNHESMGYFALRYRFSIIATVIPGGSTLAQPSSAELAELVALLEREGVRAIFADTSSPDDLAAAVARELGDEVEVVELYTEALGEDEAETIVDMLMLNARRISDALGPDG